MAESVDLSPQIISLPPHSQVHCRLLLVNGICGSNTNSDLQISSHQNNFPVQSFPVRNGRFKALIHLSSGENIIKMTFNHNGTAWTSHWPVNYLPLTENPPLHLCIIMGSDSPGIYDDVPDCDEPANLNTAIKKLRLAGYLWQAYTASQMASNGLGHRTFRFDEIWQPDTLSMIDESSRNTAKIRVLRSKYTTAEIRDQERAQQNNDAKSKNSLFDIALETIRPEFPGQRNCIAALFLDSHYENGLITGHAALGLGSNNAQYSLAIFGSHMLFSWPSTLEQVIPCFMDERDVNTNYCGIDGEGNKYWIACNVGIGAMMHEVGHLFGCPHQESGVMMRDYIRLNRSFSVIEPPGPSFLDGNECSWHRLDLLRFRTHPCFALPGDEVLPDDEMRLFGVDEGVLIKSASKILLIEFYFEDNEFPKSWIEYVDNSPSEVILSEGELRNRVDGMGKTKINVIALHGSNISIDDVNDLLSTEEISDLGKVWKSARLGIETGSTRTVLIPNSLVTVQVHSGSCLDGLEFITKDNSVLFGKQGGSPHDFSIDHDELIVGFGIRSGAWIDAVQIITNKKRSEWFGNVNGGSPHELIPPNNTYRVCGLYGQIESWVTQIGLLYCLSP